LESGPTVASLASGPPWKATRPAEIIREAVDEAWGVGPDAEPEHAWTVLMPNGDWSEADDLESALTAARTMTDDAVREGASHLLTRRAITLYRSGMRHGIGTMLAREGFERNPYTHIAPDYIGPHAKEDGNSR